jgi:4-hydroxybenzoate polyprenyltransferase
MLVFVFSITLVAYNLQRISSVILNKEKGPIGQWVKSNLQTDIVYSSLFLILGTIAFFKTINIKDLLFLIPVLFISALYTIASFRDIPFLKIILISFSWAIIIGLLPVKSASYSTLSWKFMQEFLFILAITIPFDIRDIEHDEKKKNTIPQILGIQNAKIVAIILFIASISITIMNAPKIISMATPSLVIFALLSIVLIWQSSPRKDQLYFTGIIDGLILLKAIIIYFFSV